MPAPPGRPKTVDREPHSVMFDRDLWEALSEQADASGESRSALVNSALRSWLPRSTQEYQQGGA